MARRIRTPKFCWRVTFQMPTGQMVTWNPIIAADTEAEAMERLRRTYAETPREDIVILSVEKLHAVRDHEEFRDLSEHGESR